MDPGDADATARHAEHEAAAHGFGALSALMQTLRERCPYKTSLRSREVFLEQAYANVPLLILGSRLLHEHCQKTGRTRVLFNTRDGCVWQPLFQALYPAYDTHTLVSSRRLLALARPAYVAYFRSMYRHEDSVIVDLYATGMHLYPFAKEHLGLEAPHTFMFNDKLPLPKANRAGILRWHETCWDMESLSADVGGSYVDLVDGEWRRAANEHPPWLAGAVARARDLAVALIRAAGNDARAAQGPAPAALIRRLLAPVREQCRALKYFDRVRTHK